MDAFSIPDITPPKTYVPAPQPPAGPGGPVVWRTLDDGRIEIQGEGIPVASGLYEARLRRTAERWRELAIRHAARVGIPPSNVIAIIDVESAGNPAALSPAGAIGLMQIMPSWWRGHTAAEMMDPEINATIGSDLLGTVAHSVGTGGELPRMASVYNCGSDTSKNAPRLRPGTRWGLCAEGTYIDDVVRANNYAVSALDMGRMAPVPSAPAATSASTGIGVLGMLFLAYAGYELVYRPQTGRTKG